MEFNLTTYATDLVRKTIVLTAISTVFGAKTGLLERAGDSVETIWEDFARAFLGGVLWAFSPTKMRRENPAKKTANQNPRFHTIAVQEPLNAPFLMGCGSWIFKRDTAH